MRKFILSASFLCTLVLSFFPVTLLPFTFSCCTGHGIPKSRVNYATKERGQGSEKAKRSEVGKEEEEEERAGDGSLGIYK
jgi:hypothetical protein